ncbi:hypothetical protein QYG06_17875 [Xanthomonas euvesicatoria]|uniref:Uncharacterized protein n=3 Tax=Xanthomonas TaxID=338 RepID=A0AB73H3C9_9XANT|nr:MULTISPECIES: hypothetical protein [Xanthomonas]AOY69486.1 hypothetical protein BHE83_23210 [Xanthomonas euvesicatoria pv. vesicatoria str. 85-10]APO88722.1 hypothetical protein BJD11_00675 [Xanthomonas euvesicatoria]KHL62527.1 hypothetical protein XEU66b_06500 [Xanthomonas euvesicatoria]KLB38590.1 hypothetical protein XEUV206_19580 [Xanthomonas euvesicatoria]KLB43764.1 hypothetical protein XEUV259_20500 [Xanthomonas euvesicatoria]
MSPYEAALQWIMSNPGSGSANSLAKLMMSLWNSRCAFAVSECVWNLDGARSELALRAIERYLKEGETPEFNRVCEQIHEAHPRLWELGDAASRAKAQLREKWELEDRRNEDEEQN